MSVRLQNTPLMPIRAEVDANYVWKAKNGEREKDDIYGSYFGANTSFCLKCGHAFDLRRFVDFINDPKHLCPTCRKHFDFIMRTNLHKNEASSELWPHYSHQLPNYDFAHDDDDSSPQKHQSKIEHKPVQQQPVLRPGPRPRAPPLLSLNPVINRQLSPKNGNNTPTQHWYGPVHQQIQQQVYYHHPPPQYYYG